MIGIKGRRDPHQNVGGKRKPKKNSEKHDRHFNINNGGPGLTATKVHITKTKTKKKKNIEFKSATVAQIVADLKYGMTSKGRPVKHQRQSLGQPHTHAHIHALCA